MLCRNRFMQRCAWIVRVPLVQTGIGSTSNCGPITRGAFPSRPAIHAGGIFKPVPVRHGWNALVKWYESVIQDQMPQNLSPTRAGNEASDTT